MKTNFFHKKIVFIPTLLVFAFIFWTGQKQVAKAGSSAITVLGCGWVGSNLSTYNITDSTDSLVMTTLFQPDCNFNGPNPDGSIGPTTGIYYIVEPNGMGIGGGCVGGGQANGSMDVCLNGISSLPNGTYTITADYQEVFGCTPASTCTSRPDNLTLTINRPTCSINSFTAVSPTIAPGTGTNLNFSLSGSFPWAISLVSGSVNPSPSSGTGSSGPSATGNLSSSQTYQLSCGSATAFVTVSVTATPALNAVWQANNQTSITQTLSSGQTSITVPFIFNNSGQSGSSETNIQCNAVANNANVSVSVPQCQSATLTAP